MQPYQLSPEVHPASCLRLGPATGPYEWA